MSWILGRGRNGRLDRRRHDESSTTERRSADIVHLPSVRRPSYGPVRLVYCSGVVDGHLLPRTYAPHPAGHLVSVPEWLARPTAV